MKKLTKKQWIWIGSAIVIVIIIIAIFAMTQNQQKNNQQNNPQNNEQNIAPETNQQENQQPETKTTTTKPKTTSTTKTTPTTSLSYEEALKKYADRRIQIDNSCQAHPNNVTHKDNTGIMIDNRTAQTKTIKIGTTFTIKPYSFKIVTLPDVYLKSKTILMDCDQYQNVATILIQE